jgi:CHASE2 domain-containing sensor protein
VNGGVTTTGAPYVGLDYFLEEDASLFFGRDAERTQIISNLQAARLTLLYAESGGGKSSLLRAGVAARLRQLALRNLRERGSARYVPVVFSSWHGQSHAGLIDALEAAVEPLTPDEREVGVRRDGLEHAIEDAVAAVDATPLLILDQFEEHFLYEPDDNDFDDELARCVNRRDLRANFLICVREDAYSLIGQRFKARIPNVYANYLHLDFLDEDAARDAVLQPIDVFNEGLPADAPRFEVEPALVDGVLEQVRRGRVTMGDDSPGIGAGGRARVETAYLQLVMSRLWDEEMAAGSTRLRLETLRRLGGADAIVHGHLDEVMAGLPEDQRDAASAAFRFLMTSRGRKIALSTEELRDFSETDASRLVPALEHLERARILRPVPSSEPGGDADHEIYHDVLAPAILEWRRRHARERAERQLAAARDRARRLEVRSRRLAAAVIALAAVALALALYVWNPAPLQRRELQTVDARFAVRGASAADPRLTMIAVDDRTLARLDPGHTGQIPRGAYVRILDRLREGGARAIAMDVFFTKQRAGDAALLAAIRATHDRVVMAFASFDVSGAHVRPTLFGQPGGLEPTGARVGFVGVPDDRDGHNRRTDYVVKAAADRDLETLAFATADVASGGDLRASELPAADRRAWGGQSDRTTWIDFRGPPGTIPRVSALDVLDGRVPSAAFEGKVVVVGVIARSNADVHRTPLDRGRGMPGPEIQANAIDTIMRGAPLRDVSQLVDVLLIVLFGALPALAAQIRSRALRVGAIFASAALLLVVIQVTFQAGWVVAAIAPLVALVAASVGIAALARWRAARAKRSLRERDAS